MMDRMDRMDRKDGQLFYKVLSVVFQFGINISIPSILCFEIMKNGVFKNPQFF